MNICEQLLKKAGGGGGGELYGGGVIKQNLCIFFCTTQFSFIAIKNFPTANNFQRFSFKLGNNERT